MRAVVVCLGAAFFFLNPGLACGPAEPQFTYGAEEMRHAVEGRWALTLMSVGSGDVHVTVSVQQATRSPSAAGVPARAGLVRVANACGTRTLVKAAAACLDISEMPLDVAVIEGGFTADNVKAIFRVYGTDFARGTVDLTVGVYRVLFDVKPDGTPSSPVVSVPGGWPVLATVERR